MNGKSETIDAYDHLHFVKQKIQKKYVYICTQIAVELINKPLISDKQ